MATKRRKNNPQDLVFEIGMEELPASYFDCIYSRREKVCELLKSHGLSFEDCKMYITPRRIVFHVIGLHPIQAKQEVLIKGPAYEKCYDTKGKATSALLGFLKSKAVGPGDLIEIKDEKRHCVAVKKISGGKKTELVLKEILPRFLELFTFPRTMKWNDSNIRFPRPIRWILCLYGKKTVAFKCAGLVVSNITYGHRYNAPGKIKVTNAKMYFTKIKKGKIILDEQERISIIRNLLAKEGKQLQLKIDRFDKDLIEIVARLCESPMLVDGYFKEKYLNLPADVLATCMKKHQKIFACYCKDNDQLDKCFIAVLDGTRRNVQSIVQGYERVLESRLRDAAFFIEEDTKKPLASNREKLKEVVFLGSLGTYYDKSVRLERLCDFLITNMPPAVCTEKNKNHLAIAARLCKVDLVTHLVFEFPELQGVAGREYLKREQCPEEQYRAVSDHYVPRTLNENISQPSDITDTLSALLGVADRIDTLIGALGLGIEVSGSEDPYALRRISGGMVKLIRNRCLTFSFDQLIQCAYNMYEGELKVDYATLSAQAKNIVKERIIYETQEVAGSVERMIVDAVLQSSYDDIYNVFERISVLKDMYRHKVQRKSFLQACKVVERTGNIVKSYKKQLQSHVLCNLLHEPLEQELYEVYEAKRGEFKR
ncbi:MAG: glycine--tRNA ligase subunit beta [Candidatus Omnitrophica bacterium]|nr:glycine--tRNA ligase subunit beta [Candidatus Omnitrophota bacterium]